MGQAGAGGTAISTAEGRKHCKGESRSTASLSTRSARNHFFHHRRTGVHKNIYSSLSSPVFQEGFTRRERYGRGGGGYLTPTTYRPTDGWSAGVRYHNDILTHNVWQRWKYRETEVKVSRGKRRTFRFGWISDGLSRETARGESFISMRSRLLEGGELADDVHKGGRLFRRRKAVTEDRLEKNFKRGKHGRQWRGQRKLRRASGRISGKDRELLLCSGVEQWKTTKNHTPMWPSRGGFSL